MGNCDSDGEYTKNYKKKFKTKDKSFQHRLKFVEEVKKNNINHPIKSNNKQNINSIVNNSYKDDSIAYCDKNPVKKNQNTNYFINNRDKLRMKEKLKKEETNEIINNMKELESSTNSENKEINILINELNDIDSTRCAGWPLF